MSDYSQITDFSVKDGLTTGDPEKIILGSDVDDEFAAISTAIGTKYDSSDRASTVEARALSSNTVLLTPSTLNDVLTENGGLLGEIQLLTDPGADGILGWDDSAAADSNVIYFTLGTGLLFNATTIELDFLGFEDLVDPNADSIAFWDDTAGAFAWMTATGGLEIDNAGSTIGIADAAATTSNALDITSGAFDIDLTALTTIAASGLAAGDLILIDDGGVQKAMKIEEAGMRVQTAQATQDVAAADMNTIMEFTATAILTLPLNSGTPLPVGVPIVVNMKHATQELTITAATGVTLVSPYHPAGTAAASDVVTAGGTGLLYKTATDVWVLTGDIADT